ncbi:hypothetical protein [Nocardia farcinica]|uniref:hypothetical protein n=1 Tax=Nocardia farcinica TaxID=37329 RepID=UPI002456218F|nr:hypothetical protein [Nocardia farcinica]
MKLTPLVKLTPRDMTVLSVIAEMYGAPMDLVTSMLAVSRPRAANIVRRWTEARMVSDLRVTPVPGPSWIFPTREAAQALTGRWVRSWVPTPKMAAHVRATLELRLALVGLDLERWISERALRAEVPPTRPGVPRPHIHDGRYITSSGELRAVEVELTAKNLSAAKSAIAQSVQAARGAGCDGVTYFCRGNAVKNVIRRAAASLDLSGGPVVRLADLDEVVSSSAPRPGLRVIEGGASDHEIPQVTGPNDGKGKAV